jgi:uncharacterized protein (DUF2147 family)
MRSFVMQLHRSNLRARTPRLTVLAAGAAVLCLPVHATWAAPKEVGVWIDNSGDGAVKIEPCGDKLCGRIVWLKDPLNDKGQPKRDRYNPDESRRNRTICGLPILGELAQMPEGGFDNGWVYDPKEGKSYSVAIVANGTNQLSVTGYKGVKFLGKTFTWTRATTTLPSCEVQPASAKPADGVGGMAGAAGMLPMKAKKAPAAVDEAQQDAAATPNPVPRKQQPSAKETDSESKPVRSAPADDERSGDKPAKKKAAASATATAKPKKPAPAKADTTEVLPWATGQ